MDLSLIVALAALFFSLVSPIISEWTRGRYRLKEKRLDAALDKEKQNQEFYRRHRAEVIENYIRAAGQAIHSPTPENMASFGSVSGEVYLYVEKPIWHSLDSLRSNISNGNWEAADADLTHLCKTLSKQEVRSEYPPEPDRRKKNDPERV